MKTYSYFKSLVLWMMTILFSIPVVAQNNEPETVIYTIGIEFRDRNGGKIYSSVDFTAKSSDETVCWVRFGDEHVGSAGVGWFEVVVIGEGTAVIVIEATYEGCKGEGRIIITNPEPASGIKTSLRIKIDQPITRTFMLFGENLWRCPYDWIFLKIDENQFLVS